MEGVFWGPGREDGLSRWRNEQAITGLLAADRMLYCGIMIFDAAAQCE